MQKQVPLTILGGYPNTLMNQTGKMPQLASLSGTLIRTPSTNKVAAAKTTVDSIHTGFALPLPPMTAIVEANVGYNAHIESKLNLYYFHPDHLGSSSYMTNRAGVVCQHIEHLPFGETLVDEHLNSNNSPFKFNGKEMDEETGNYYYAARYYDPKFSIFISVDPLAESTFSAYGYCYNNPINMVDPDGMSPIFDYQGNYMGSDSNGFSGEVIFMSRKNFLSLKGNGVISHSQALSLGKKASQVFSQVFVHSPEIQYKKLQLASKVISFIVSKMVGTDMSDIDNGEVSIHYFHGGWTKNNTYDPTNLVYNNGSNEIMVANTGTLPNGKARITYELEEWTNWMTVENILNTWWHEYHWHYKKKVGEDGHLQIYKDQKQRPSYPLTTPGYKQYIETRIREESEPKKEAEQVRHKSPRDL